MVEELAKQQLVFPFVESFRSQDDDDYPFRVGAGGIFAKLFPNATAARISIHILEDIPPESSLARSLTVLTLADSAVYSRNISYVSRYSASYDWADERN